MLMRARQQQLCERKRIDSFLRRHAFDDRNDMLFDCAGKRRGRGVGGGKLTGKKNEKEYGVKSCYFNVRLITMLFWDILWCWLCGNNPIKPYFDVLLFEMTCFSMLWNWYSQVRWAIQMCIIHIIGPCQLTFRKTKNIEILQWILSSCSTLRHGLMFYLVVPLWSQWGHHSGLVPQSISSDISRLSRRWYAFNFVFIFRHVYTYW